MATGAGDRLVVERLHLTAGDLPRGQDPELDVGLPERTVYARSGAPPNATGMLASTAP
jgi:hypothetical protein